MELVALKRSFSAYFNSKPEFVVRAPGRVNLIGEHTDYNDGFVLPMAIDHGVWMALRSRRDDRVHIHSVDLNTGSTFELHSIIKGQGWMEYIKGVAHSLQVSGYKLRGFDAVMSGDVPRGAGLSSSAAVELAAARALCASSGIPWEPHQMALLAQKAENNWVGVQCGIMDQMASAASRAGHALFLDCRSLEIEHIPLPDRASIVILDTSTRRGLVDSAYNERRRQCEEAARLFGVQALRDVSIEMLEEKTKSCSSQDAVVLKRARHIITENSRVLQAIKALKAGRLDRAGELFNTSHDSLRDDFEVTNDALNIMVECARGQQGCYGARMTGAGFGGCAVALVEREAALDFSKAVQVVYQEKSGLKPAMYVCQASEGASLVEQ